MVRPFKSRAFPFHPDPFLPCTRHLPFMTRGQSASVNFLGKNSDGSIVTWLPWTHLFVVPSLSESFPPGVSSRWTRVKSRLPLSLSKLLTEAPFELDFPFAFSGVFLAFFEPSLFRKFATLRGTSSWRCPTSFGQSVRLDLAFDLGSHFGRLCTPLFFRGTEVFSVE